MLQASGKLFRPRLGFETGCSEPQGRCRDRSRLPSACGHVTYLTSMPLERERGGVRSSCRSWSLLREPSFLEGLWSVLLRKWCSAVPRRAGPPLQGGGVGCGGLQYKAALTHPSCPQACLSTLPTPILEV